jgi:hypothetical protein
MPHAYTEDQLVEQPAMRLFAELSSLPLRLLSEQVKLVLDGETATLAAKDNRY